MSFTNIDTLQLGNILQIAFSAGVRSQLSKDMREWDMVGKFRLANTLARELRFMFQNNFGPSAVQFANPGTTNRAFPNAQQSNISENTAKLKELDVTIEIEHSLWERASKSPEKYAEPLALEMEGKLVAAKRLVGAMFYGDGTGVIAQVASVVDTTGANGFATVVVGDAEASRGFIGLCQFGDILVASVGITSAQRAPTTSGSFYGWRVKSRVRSTATLVIEPVDANGNVLSLTASNLIANDSFYRVGQALISDIPNLSSPVSDYGTVTTVFPGLESLTAADGRVVHGITMSGAAAGTQVDAASAALDVNLIHQLMDEVKVNVGNVYSWKSMIMSPEAQRSFIQSREVDRRFISADDGKRGTPKFSYIHQDDVLEIVVSEFLKKSRVICLPEGKGSGNKVLEYWGTDFITVKGQGMGDFHLKPSASGGFVNMMVSYMRGYQTLICKHPASVATLKNFTIA